MKSIKEWSKQVEEITLSKIKEVCYEDELRSLFEDPSSKINNLERILKDPNEVKPGSLSQESQSLILHMMESMRKQGTKQLAIEPPEEQTSPAPAGSDEQLFYKDRLPIPRTQKFRKTPEELSQYQNYTNERDQLLIKKTISIDTDLANTERVKGNEFYTSQRFKDALSKYSSAICHNPKYAPNFTNRAAAYMLTEHPHMAISDCRRALLLQPDFVRGYNRMARAYICLNRILEAIDIMSEAKEVLKYNANISQLYKAIDDCLKQSVRNTNINKVLSRFFFELDSNEFTSSPKFLQLLFDYDIISINLRDVHDNLLLLLDKLA